MHKIVFKNPDGKPKPEMAKSYSSIISSNISGLKCPTCDQHVEVDLKFRAPDTYMIYISACCQDFHKTIEKEIGLMLS